MCRSCRLFSAIRSSLGLRPTCRNDVEAEKKKKKMEQPLSLWSFSISEKEAFQCGSESTTLSTCVFLWLSSGSDTTLNMSWHSVNVLTWPHSLLASDFHHMWRRLTSAPAADPTPPSKKPTHTACCSLTSVLSRGCFRWKWGAWRRSPDTPD